MPRCKQKVQITSRHGLHARPASLFVQLAAQFRAKILVRKGNEEVDGASIMGLLMLALERGHAVELTADGPEAKEALEALARFLTTEHEDPSPVSPPRGARG